MNQQEAPAFPLKGMAFVRMPPEKEKRAPP